MACDRQFAAHFSYIQPWPLMDRPLFLGVDIGSTTLKAVLLSANGEICSTISTGGCSRSFRRASTSPGVAGSCGRCNLCAVAKTLNDFLAQSGTSRNQVAYTVVTGSQVVDDLSPFRAIRHLR